MIHTLDMEVDTFLLGELHFSMFNPPLTSVIVFGRRIFVPFHTYNVKGG